MKQGRVAHNQRSVPSWLKTVKHTSLVKLQVRVDLGAGSAPGRYPVHVPSLRSLHKIGLPTGLKSHQTRSHHTRRFNSIAVAEPLRIREKAERSRILSLMLKPQNQWYSRFTRTSRQNARSERIANT
jgi:hypothetical protein